MLSREKKIAMDIAGLGLTINDIEHLDKLIKAGMNAEAQEKLLELSKVSKFHYRKSPLRK